MATATAPVPAYCSPSIVKHHTLNPVQIAQCFKLGYSRPTTGAAHLGYAVGHASPPVLAIVAVVVLVLVAIAKSGGRSPATQRS